jgi:hypothetical protein
VEGARFDSLLGRIGDVADSCDDVLFTVCDEWQVNSIARATGGYQLASLRNNHYVTYEYVDGTNTRAIAQLPPLFGGTADYYWRGMSIRSVEVEGLTDMVYTTGGYGYYFWDVMPMRPVLMDGAVMAKSSDRYYPWQPNSVTLRLAGRLDRAARSRGVAVTVTGTIGGLGFTQRITGTPSTVGADTGAVEWALIKAEQLAQENWWENAAAIKAVGKEYHIVTRQTSLLALEPGVELWEDTAAEQTEANSRDGAFSVASSASIVASSDLSYGGSGLSLDDVSLEDLINQVAVSQTGLRAPSARDVVRVSGNRIELRLASPAQGDVRAELFDMMGRRVASHVWSGDGVRKAFVWDAGSGATKLSSGRYTVRVSVSGTVRVFRVGMGL